MVCNGAAALTRIVLESARDAEKLYGLEFFDGALQLNHADDAIAELRSALALDNNLPEAHYELAAALKARGRLEEAAHELQIAHKLNPNLPHLP